MVLGHGTRTKLALTCGGDKTLHGGNPNKSDGVLVLVPRGSSRQLVIASTMVRHQRSRVSPFTII